MKVVQLCFRVGNKAHNDMVVEQLKVVHNELEGLGELYVVKSCHLNRAIVEAKGFSTETVDALEGIFGEKYVNCCEATNFEDAMQEMDKYRTKLASEADRIFVIGEQSVGNIALEVELFTRGKVRFFN